MRYDPINLTLVPPPASVQVLDFDTAYANWQADFASAAAAWNITYNVATLRSDPMGWLMSVAAYRGDIYKRGEINDAIKAVLVPTALGGDLDNVTADLNVVRRVLVPANPNAVPPTAAVMETDTSLRNRRLLAPEALSCAGPLGAYRFFALQASPDVLDARAYGPETTLVTPGQVMVVIQSATGPQGVPPGTTLQAVASFLTAQSCPDLPGYVMPTPAAMDANVLTPDTDYVIVRAVQPTPYSIAGVLTVPPGPSAASVVAASQAAIAAYCAAQGKIGGTINLSSLIAAGRLLAPDGTSPALDFQLTSPTATIAPGPLGLPLLTGITLTSVVSNG